MNSEKNYLQIAKPCVALGSEEIETIEHLASVGFCVTKIARVLGKDLRLFRRDFFNPGTPIYDAYQRGILLAKSTVDSVLLENAKKGNLTAMQQYYKILDETNFENIRQEIFNNE